MDVTSLFIEREDTEQLNNPFVSCAKFNVHGNAIGTLATSRYFILSTSNVNEVAEVFEQYGYLDVLGVVDPQGKVLGIITRNVLFNRLGKLYGRSICFYKSTENYIEEPCGIYNCTRNIFSIASEINRFLDQGTIEYFLLLGDNNQFYGIFRNIDMMIYLTGIESRNFDFARTVMEHIVQKESCIRSSLIDIVCASQQAKGVGGDYYNVTELEQDKWLFSIWDISGKGVASALVVSFLSGIFKFHDFKSSHSCFLNQLNLHFFKTFPKEWFSTGIFVCFDGATKKIKYYDFGHSLCLVYRNGKAYPLKTRKASVPLGVSPKIELRANRLQLQTGDFLFFYTDGLVEQTNTKGEEFPIEHVHRIIFKGLKNNTELIKIKKAILGAVNIFREQQPQRDDMTFILCRIS
ncbi:MAG: SpoIIE family protein phosphatase [Spirochaetales bacterium]|nr:SpoIIE family protein phosphatase [Spirochaetales bacterium]